MFAFDNDGAEDKCPEGMVSLDLEQTEALHQITENTFRTMIRVAAMKVATPVVLVSKKLVEWGDSRDPLSRYNTLDDKEKRGAALAGALTLSSLEIIKRKSDEFSAVLTELIFEHKALCTRACPKLIAEAAAMDTEEALREEEAVYRKVMLGEGPEGKKEKIEAIMDKINEVAKAKRMEKNAGKN